MFEIKMTREEIIEGLKANYGVEFTAPDVRAFCAMNDIAYQTVTKKLDQFKVGRGKWNLEVTQKVVEDIEKSFNAPAVTPIVQENLVPDQDNTFVKFGSFNDRCFISFRSNTVQINREKKTKKRIVGTKRDRGKSRRGVSTTIEPVI